MFSNALHLNGSDIATTCYPQDWRCAAESYLADIQSGLSPKAVVCGAKGVGKSSLIRYLVNRILSRHHVVALIDCDVGQPEYNPPGLMSLHLLVDPVLSPPHLHMRTPELSFFLGDVSTKHVPELFVQSLHLLHEKYCELQAQYSRRGTFAAAKSQNSFSILIRYRGSQQLPAASCEHRWLDPLYGRGAIGHSPPGHGAHTHHAHLRSEEWIIRSAVPRPPPIVNSMCCVLWVETDPR